MLCSLSAYERSACHLAACCHTFYDLGDLFRIVLAAGNIIQEKQRLSACAGNVVNAHCNGIYSYGVMLVKDKCQLDLCAHAVGSGQ